MALIGLVGMAAFAVTLQISVAGAYRTTRPQLALIMAPLDATARARLASQLVASDESRQAARSLATDAIMRDALQPGALRVLAESLDERKAASLATAEVMMMQAARLSKRDVATQMWLIEYFGRTGQAERMVQHFDIVMRASESARGSGFPMLALAASDQRGEELIIRTLSAQPNWAKEFATFTIGSGPDLEFASRAAQLLLDTDDPKNRVHYLLLLRRLTEVGLYLQAWELYGKPGLARANAKKLLVRNGDFETSEDGSPFDWTFAQEPELWAARERADTGEGLVLRVAAHNGRAGEVAWQMLHLSPGLHRVHLRTGDVPDDRYDRPEFLVACVGRTGGSLVSLISDRPGAASQELSASFTVPQGCLFQRIAIRVAGDGPLSDTPPWIDDIRIE